MEDEIVKVCKVHGDLKKNQVREFIDKRIIKIQSVCKMCHKKSGQIYSRKNKEKRLIYLRKYNADNQEIIKKYRKKRYELNKEMSIKKSLEWQHKNKDKFREIQLKSQRKSRFIVSDSYARDCLKKGTKLSAKKIPQDVVSAKVAHILLIRKIREIKNVNKKHG